MFDQLSSENWEKTFRLVHANEKLQYTRDDVAELVGVDENRDDTGVYVYGVFKMSDGKFLYIEGVLLNSEDEARRSKAETFVADSLEGILRSCESVHDVFNQRKLPANYYRTHAT